MPRENFFVNLHKMWGDGWLCEEMSGYVGIWVVMRVAKLVARLLATAALWVRIQTSLKNRYKMGDISKGVAKTL